MRFTSIFAFIILLTFTNCQKQEIYTNNPPPPTQLPSSDPYWEKDSPSAHGFSEAELNIAINNANELNNFYALLIIRNQKLVVEEYFEERNENTLFQLRSITKNFTSALTGIAIDKQWLSNVDETIQPYFPNLTTDGRQNITIRNLLNMSSGLAWNEDQQVLDLIQFRIPDPIEYILSQPLENTPGTVFNYNSVSPHVVTKILTQQKEQSLSALMEQEIFDPLGIKVYEWEKDPENEDWGGFGLQLTARDLAKFGQLYLNEGNWEGEQILSPDWVKQSSQPQINSSNSGYSFQWWVSTKSETPLFYGQGYGGQGLLLFPERNLIIISCQEAWVPSNQSSKQWGDFIEKVYGPILMSMED